MSIKWINRIDTITQALLVLLSIFLFISIKALNIEIDASNRWVDASVILVSMLIFWQTLSAITHLGLHFRGLKEGGVKIIIRSVLIVYVFVLTAVSVFYTYNAYLDDLFNFLFALMFVYFIVGLSEFNTLDPVE